MGLINDDLLRRIGVGVFPNARAEGFGLLRASQERQPNSVPVLGKPTLVSDLRIGEFSFPVPPVITIEYPKNVISTPTAGGKPVVEIISLENHRISIKGYIKNTGIENINGFDFESEEFPSDFLREMLSMYEQNESLDVECELLAYFNIQQVVLENFKFDFIPGYANAFVYELTCMSDKAIELELIEEF